MGRLFWKFFLAILFAQMAATLGVGAAFWVRDQARDKATAASLARIDRGPGAQAILDAAALTLKYGGEAGLREFAGTVGRKHIYVIDAAGKDLLGRSISPALYSAAERLAGDGAVRELTAPDGKRFSAFLQRAEGERGPGMHMAPPGVFRMAPADGPGGPGALGGAGKPPFQHRFPYVTMVVGILASLVFAALLAWYFSRPIRALRGAFEAAASGDLQPRFANQRGSDELATLGHDFDRMSGQLRALMDNQRRLLHDVSHELRSPLARLQAAIGLAHQQPQRLAVSLERIELESVRMDKLVGELLTLSRLDTGAALPAAENIALLDLVDDIAEDASFEAASQGRKVIVTGTTAAQVRGAPDLLWRAIENVVRNAIKYSPPGGVVTIGLADLAGAALIQVNDQGAGVDAADLEQIFQPFYRSNPTANHVDGHGLGLAIARRVIEAHGGTIGAANGDDGGLVATIRLPALAQ